MTVQFRISGLDYNKIQYYALPLEFNYAEAIHENASHFVNKSHTWSAQIIVNKLSAISQKAESIAKAISSKRPVDEYGRIIDKITQHAELLVLTIDLEQIAETATKFLQTKPNYNSNIQWCNALKMQAQHMRNDLAQNLQIQITAEIQALTNQLTEMSDFLPRDCFGVVAQYSVT